MKAVVRTLRHAFAMGLLWAGLWLLFWTLVLGIVCIVDPETIEPGEGQVAFAVLGSMGLLSGIVFGFLVSIAGRRRATVRRSRLRVVGLGLLASALVQAAFLDHGDRGLVANLTTALLLTLSGGGMTVIWHRLAQHAAPWQHSPDGSWGSLTGPRP
jgi:hypothetical protein